MQVKELLLEGVGSIIEGMNPKLIRIKLEPSSNRAARKPRSGKQSGRRRRARGRRRDKPMRDRRRKPAEHENHERWLVSYADFITLLFAFFVVMFASSQTDKSKAKQISEAVEKALADGKSVGVPPAVAKILGGTMDDKGQGNAQMKGPGGAQRAAKEAPPQDVVELAPSLKSLDKRAGRGDQGRQGRSQSGATRPGGQSEAGGLFPIRHRYHRSRRHIPSSLSSPAR